jgi:alpha-glucoside transport system permease protein
MGQQSVKLERDQEQAARPGGPQAWLSTTVGRILVSLFVPLVTFIVLWQVFLFLRDAQIPLWITALIAIVWGVGGVLVLFSISNYAIEQLPGVWRRRLTPFVFVGPALAILTWYLVLPTLRSLYASFFDSSGASFVGLANYAYAFTSPEMIQSYRNNFLFWLIFGTAFSVSFGLLIAVLADRLDPISELICKTLIFMPMVISGVAASVIWKFIYEFRPPGAPQIGLLNGILAAFDGQPQGWLLLQPWNNLMLVAILIWLQTGYSMVILSAAIKGVPADLYEAGRIDGATELQIFRNITVPSIQGAIITVATTTLLGTLKVFDIVQSMTGGNFGTQVIANVQFVQLFRVVENGRAAAIAIVLLVAVLPVMYYNLRQFGNQTEAF